MIDLSKKGLPDVIYCNGRPYSIYTDFRYWLKFYKLTQKKDLKLNELYFLFKNKTPHDDLFLLDVSEETADFSPQLLEFFYNPNATPKGESKSATKTFDYILDGEYIYASFMQVYGIDLTECDMHWHKFKALFASLPENCKMREIMSFRSWKEDNRKYKTIANELKNDWSFPLEKIDKETEEGLKQDFYNAY